MKVGKWNYKTKKYDDYELPSGATGYTEHLGQEISCASCGKRVKAGNAFTSLEIHNDLGLGYLVCEQCYSKEIQNQTREQKDER